MESLYGYFEAAAERFPGRTAVVEASGGAALTYRELSAKVDGIALRLRELGVGAGDRVGLCLPKGIDALASLFAVLQVGAAYVPVDAGAPEERNAFIFEDCAVAVVVRRGAGGELEVEACGRSGDGVASPDLAYILYTSGSTGKPKGVMLSHGNARSFVDWCSEVFAPGEEDRFSSHAPFHFDLSILDVHVAVKHGAAVVLIDEALGKNARALGPAIAEHGITVWYSTPTVLRLLTESGGLREREYPALRAVLFAGEVYPVRHLRSLVEALPGKRFYNLYGPTETNVCTWYEIPSAVPAGREVPYPIGRPCSNVVARVAGCDGREVECGEEGELQIAEGGPVMRGYWNLPERTAEAFVTDGNGVRWYRTGDVVREVGDGVLDYVGRRDRMVKRRGYRVELGEIETAMYRHPDIAEAAVVAVPDAESGVSVWAVAALTEEAAGRGKAPSVLQMKMFCSKVLLPYMIPDGFRFVGELPKTSTDKIDYQALVREVSGEGKEKD